MWRFLTFKTKQKKTKRTPAPNPGRPTDFSQAEGAAGVERAPLPQRARASAAAARIQSLGTQVRGPVPPRPWGCRGGAGGVRSAQPGLGLGAERTVGLGCAPPREAPAPPAGIPGMSLVGKQLDRLWAEGEVEPGISRALLHNIPPSVSVP